MSISWRHPYGLEAVKVAKAAAPVRVSLSLLPLMCLAGSVPLLPALRQQPSGETSFLANKLKVWNEQQQALVPRGGRWLITYRELHHPKSEQTLVYDSSASEYAQQGVGDLPCWLRLVVTCRVEGLRDGTGDFYTGPLLAKTSGDCTIWGPYPEGFVCVQDGACDISLIPKFLPFTESSIGISLCFRPPPIQIAIGDELFPPTPDYYNSYIGQTYPQEPIWGQLFRFARPDPDAFRMDEVQIRSNGARSMAIARAHFTMRGGRAAPKLPVKFEWEFEAGEGAPPVSIWHEGTTDADGLAHDSAEVPPDSVKGRVRFWFHASGEEFLPASGLVFEIGQQPAE